MTVSPVEHHPCGPVTHLQFAANGRWEEAFRLEPCGASDVEAWLQRAPEDVALECFFGAQNGPAQFLGVRLARLNAASRREVIRRLAARYLDGPMSLNAARNVLQSCLGGAPLWSVRPDFLELGMLDAWSSHGPLRFWTAGAAVSPAAALRSATEGQPRFRGFTDLPLAIEAGVLGMLPQWRGIVVSEPHAQGWLADFQRAGSVAEALAVSEG